MQFLIDTEEEKEENKSCSSNLKTSDIFLGVAQADAKWIPLAEANKFILKYKGHRKS